MPRRKRKPAPVALRRLDDIACPPDQPLRTA